MDGLNPVYRIGDQIVEAITAHRSVGNAEARKRAQEILAKVGIGPSKFRSYAHELSGGQRQRVMIAMALALEPELVIADEPTTALDTVTQARILKLFRRLQRELAVAVVFISHDLSVLAQTCDRVLILYAGQVVELGDCGDLLSRPRHPYTVALVNAYPELGTRKRKFAGLSGRPPDLAKPSAGCRFAERCPRRREVCGESEPALVEVAPGHTVRCHFT
jgi:oligopeptide/dipeptide ABC transporter ATP-binding protein